jgi:predicted nucleic acid-binding protein
MATSASARTQRGRDVLVDTSVAVALVVADHEHHAEVTRAIGRRRVGLAGHAAFETFSVLTRMPPPARRTPAVVGRLLEASFPATRFLGARDTEALLGRLADLGIAGGAVYDALVGAVAVAHDLALATRDQRALDVYRALDVEIELLA